VTRIGGKRNTQNIIELWNRKQIDYSAVTHQWRQLYRVKQELPKKNIDHNVLQKRGSGKSP
jgi:hypothetical protein